MELISVPVIVSLVFSVMEIYKKITEKYSIYEKLVRLIPIISTILGIIIGDFVPIPIVGALIGAAVGIVVALAVYYLTPVINDVKISVYNLVKSINSLPNLSQTPVSGLIGNAILQGLGGNKKHVISIIGGKNMGGMNNYLL